MTEKLCINCKHCNKYRGAFMCFAPQNIEISTVTGEGEIKEFRYCSTHRQRRYVELDVCGPQGRWFEQADPKHFKVKIIDRIKKALGIRK